MQTLFWDIKIVDNEIDKHVHSKNKEQANSINSVSEVRHSFWAVKLRNSWNRRVGCMHIYDIDYKDLFIQQTFNIHVLQ